MLADVAEIDELMSRGYDTYNDVSEADLDAELAGLEGELAADVPAEGLAAPDYAGIPEAPAGIGSGTAPIAAGGGGYAGYPSYPSVPSTVPQPAAPAAVPASAARF